MWFHKSISPLLSELQDIRPANPKKAVAIMNGHYDFDHGAMDMSDDMPFNLTGASTAWQDDLHSFAWLRHFSLGGDDMAGQARHYVDEWIDYYHQSGDLGAPSVVAHRLISWVINGRCLTTNDQDKKWQAKLQNSLIHQGRFLMKHSGSFYADKDALLSSYCAIALLGLALPHHAHWLERGFSGLKQEIARQILPDGGHISRNPSRHLASLMDLLILKTNLLNQGRPASESLSGAIDRMFPMLRFFRHGDGRLALFNGAVEENSENAKAALHYDDIGGRPFAFAPHSGYQRLAAKNCLLLMDVGAPPPQNYGRDAHAGCLSLEMSLGKQRFIVNCGAAIAQNDAWRKASQATAAHSTLTLQNTSSARKIKHRLFSKGLDGISQVDSHRNENHHGVWLDAGHDGYMRQFGLIHRRRLFLNQKGTQFYGEDVLQPAIGQKNQKLADRAQKFAIRFHFHPDIRCGLTHNDTMLIARLPNGEAWRFKAQSQTKSNIKAHPCALRKEASVYLGACRHIRHNEQMVVQGQTPKNLGADPEAMTKINWLWQKIEKTA